MVCRVFLVKVRQAGAHGDPKPSNLNHVQVRQERGDVDYDSIESMDLELVQEHIVRLSKGETCLTPVYNMKTGYRDPPGKEMTLAKGGVLIIEGIHALNPG